MTATRPRRPAIDPDSVPLMRVRTDRVVGLGTVLWLVALVVILLVPSLHDGGREWWPWVCVAGLGLGVLAGAYVRSGKADHRGA